MPSRLRTAVFTAAALLAADAMPVLAADTFTFPSANGVLIVTSTPNFGKPSADFGPGTIVTTTLGTAIGRHGHVPPPPLTAPTPYDARFGKPPVADPYGFQFLTYALTQASFANYAADYYRLFAPNYAVTAWTDRVSGIVQAGYGGAVDSWTAGAYYLGPVPGPRRRAESPPDLTLIPKFLPHPELEDGPTFQVE